MRLSSIILTLFAISLAGFAQTSELRTFDVPYVPTPQSVVEAMLKLASVGADDVLVDLGSGDGRIVITAAKQFGARAIGVERDPAFGA
jgi:methylase of polypeptide subunit release factors